MSTVPTSVFPNTTLKLNELEAVVQPRGVHPKHLMRLCNQREVSSIIELRQTLPRCVWPQLRYYTEASPTMVNNFFDNLASGTPKYAVPQTITTNWAGTPQHNVFRIAIVTEADGEQFATEELMMEQEDYWFNLMRLRLEYYADVVESILLFRLLVERSVPLFGGPPISFMGVFASLAAACLQAEAGTENVYFMLDTVKYAFAMRQSPMRLGSAGYIIFNQETPKFNVVPVALRPFFAAFANNAVGYTDYLVKATTRNYINKFRFDRQKREAAERNRYKVMYERYVSYEFPIFTHQSIAFTWAFRVNAGSATNIHAVDDAGTLVSSDASSVFFTGSAPF